MRHDGGMALSIEPCVDKRAKRRFEELAEDLHGGHPAFIPPVPGSIRNFLSERHPFQRRHGEIFPFLAVRDGRAVGRIAAIVNRTHTERYADGRGFFGFFECEDNVETARALFRAAEDTLRAKGFTSVRGPYNPSINDECGLLVEGEAIPVYLGLTWNPAYYERLVLACGYVQTRAMYGYQLPLHRLEPPPRLTRIVERAAKRSSLILRPIDMKRLGTEMEIIHEVYNATLERNWGFTPISMDDLLTAADTMKQIADPAMILIAEMAGENAGVALSLPNINEILALTKKTPRWLRFLHFAWLLKTRRIGTARQIIYGISPRYRDKGGLHAWLLYEQFVKAKERFTDAELGWIEETNTEMIGHVTLLGANQHRTWRFYEKPFENHE